MLDEVQVSQKGHGYIITISLWKLDKSVLVVLSFFKILVDLKDPMNLGAILRGAYFLGVDRVITSGKRW